MLIAVPALFVPVASKAISWDAHFTKTFGLAELLAEYRVWIGEQVLLNCYQRGTADLSGVESAKIGDVYLSTCTRTWG